MCGAEIVSVNPQTTGYLNWHIADNGNGKGVRLCCFGEVAWVENAFCKHGIQLDLVFRVGENDLLEPAYRVSVYRRDLTLVSASS